MEIQMRERIQKILEDSFIGQFLKDENITDISYNGEEMRIQNNVKGRYKPEFQPTKEQVYQLGKKIADEMGKEFTNNNPILETEMGYLRVSFIHTEVSPSGCTFSIRVSRPKLAIHSLEKLANKEVARLMEVLIKADQNIIISGKTGAGKTELQKLLVGFIPDNKKITLIEDTMDSHIKELYPEKDINSWRTLMDETREKKITYNDLIKAGLRNNPDWLIVAETRGSEAYDMLECALTDHSIITTLHAKKAEAIPSRLLSMIGQKYNVNEIVLGKDIVNTLKFGVYMTMNETENGIERYIREIVEFTDFTEKGVEYIPVYRVYKEYNETTGEYRKEIEMNPLSKETIEELKYKGLYHLVPSIFIEKKETRKISAI